MAKLPNWDPAKHPHGEHGHWASVASGDASAKKAAVAKGAGKKPRSIVGKKVKVQLRGGAIHPGVVDREYDTFHDVNVKGHGTIQVPKNPGALDHQIIPSRVRPTGIPAAAKPIDPAVFKHLPGLPRTSADDYREKFEAAGGEIGRIRTPGYRRPSTVIAERIALLEADIKKNGDASRNGGGEKAARLKHLRTQLRRAQHDGK